MSPSDGPGTTHISLLVRLRVADPDAWTQLVDLYGPLLFGWCRKSGLSEADAHDVGQDVFRAVLRGISTFRKEQPSDTFRGWLRTITRNKLRDFVRHQARRPVAPGGSTHLRMQGQIEEVLPADDDPCDVQDLVRRALTQVRTEFSENAVRAFLGTAVELRSAADVSRELNMTANAVNIAKLRVGRALRLALGEIDPETSGN